MKRRSLTLVFAGLLLCTGFVCLTLRQYLMASNNSCQSEAHAFLDIPARNLVEQVNDPASGVNSGTTNSQSLSSITDWNFLEGGATSSAVFLYEQLELPIENNDTESAMKTSASSGSFCWIWTQGSTLASSNAQGQYTPVT